MEGKKLLQKVDSHEISTDFVKNDQLERQNSVTGAFPSITPEMGKNKSSNNPKVDDLLSPHHVVTSNKQFKKEAHQQTPKKNLWSPSKMGGQPEYQINSSTNNLLASPSKQSQDKKQTPDKSYIGNSGSKLRNKIIYDAANNPDNHLLLETNKQEELDAVENEYWGNLSVPAQTINFSDQYISGRDSSQNINFQALKEYQKDQNVKFNKNKVGPAENSNKHASEMISQQLIEQGSSEQGAPSVDLDQIQMEFDDLKKKEGFQYEGPIIKQSQAFGNGQVQKSGAQIRIEDMQLYDTHLVNDQGFQSPVDQQMISNFNFLIANPNQIQHSNSIISEAFNVRSTISSGQYDAPIPRNFKLNQHTNDLKLLRELNAQNQQNLITIPELSRGESFDQAQIPFNFQILMRDQLNQKQKEDQTLPSSERSDTNHHLGEQQQSSSSSSEEAKLQRILSAEQNPRRFDSQAANMNQRYPTQNYLPRQRTFTKVGQDQQSNIFHLNNQEGQADEGLVDVDQMVFDDFQPNNHDSQSQVKSIMSPTKTINAQGIETLSLQRQPSNSQYQRFNKQFFEDLKHQQIGFATILQDRRASHISHATFVNSNLQKEQENSANPFHIVDQQIRNINLVQQQKQQLLEYVQNPIKGLVNYGNNWNKKKKNQNFLLDLQTRIEFNNQMKNNIERAIILFNEKPKKGLDFLIKNQLLEYDPDTISEFLLTTPGLSKFAIGQYIGHNDDFNIAVLRAFCNKIDFRGMEIDEALRLFLSQFRLPGESQQIDRIIEQFSLIYFGDNPTDFEEPNCKGGLDGVYVLAYSLIFLNTLNHNPKVSAQRKLTKEQFINQNTLANPGFPVHKLEDMYQRIMSNEFKTDTQYVEKIYERIRAFNHEDKPTRDTIKRSTNVLQAGEFFLKFGRMGKPHMRFVQVSDDEEMIYWYEVSQEDQESIQEVKNRGLSLMQKLGTRAQLKWICCEDIIDIKVGYNASPVLKRHSLPIEFDDLIFSIQTRTRSLDLQAKTSEVRNRWVKFLKLIHNEKEQKTKAKIQNTENQYRQQKQRFKNELEEIWEQDIMTNFSAHWDYKNHCPKNAQSNTLGGRSSGGTQHSRRSLEGLKQKGFGKKLLCKLSSCTSIFKKKQTNHSIISGDKEDFSPQPINFESEYDGANYLGTINMKGFLLEQLWRKGIPPKFRQKLWPFVIQNKLEISKKLYQIHLGEGLLTLKRIARTQKASKGLNKMIIEKIEQDIRRTLIISDYHRAQRQSDSHYPIHLHQQSFKTQPKNEIIEEEIKDDHLFQVAPGHKFEEFNMLHSGDKLKQNIPTMRNLTFEDNATVANNGSPQSPSTKAKDRPSILQESHLFNISENELTHERLLNIIVAFVSHRPDISYLPNMSFIAGMFLTYCNDYDAYVSFTNFIHNHYFFDLFQGNVSDIKLRIDKFNKYFKIFLPDLFSHFETLDITTDLFLIDWLLTLFVQHLDLDIVSRIWDNFMLDGEVFALKVGLALLTILESKLQNQSYYTIINCLRGETCTDDYTLHLIDEEKLFSIIELINIDQNDYYDDLKMQKWSYQKSKILGAVFK